MNNLSDLLIMIQPYRDFIINNIFDNTILMWTIFAATFFLPSLYIKYSKKEDSNNRRMIVFVRILTTWLFLVFIVRDFIFVDHELKGLELYITKGVGILFILLMARSSFSLFEHVLDLKIQSKRQSNSKITWKILAKLFLSIGSLIAILNITGLGDKFGMTAVVSLVGVFLGLTSGVWFPGMKSGIVMLMSKTIEEEDIIEVPELGIYGVINSIGLFSTVIRNEIDNHRIIVANSKLENSTINNLSKPARVGGLRECLEFKIGYMKEGKPISIIEIKKYMENAFEKAKISSLPITINFEKSYEIYLVNPGDHALEWKFYYFTDNVKKRIKDKAYLYEVFYKESIISNISLSTPLSNTVEII